MGTDDTLTFDHPQAQVYVLRASDLFQEAQGPGVLGARIVIYPSGSGPTRYTLPRPPGIALRDFSSRKGYFELVALRGNPEVDFVDRWINNLSEDFLSGLGTTFVSNSGDFRGRTYVLP